MAGFSSRAVGSKFGRRRTGCVERLAKGGEKGEISVDAITDWEGMQRQGEEGVREMETGYVTEIAMRVEAEFFDGGVGAIVEFFGREEGLRGEDRERV